MRGRILWALVAVATMLVGLQSATAAPLSGVNCSGFSRWDVNRFGEQNLIGQPTAFGCWFDSGSAVADKRWLLFNLNGLCTLNSMTVLNFKRPGEEGRQMKTAPIEYSVNGVTWTTLQASHTFALYPTLDTIAFGGVQARFVRVGNPVTGYTNQGTGELPTGLTEVTFDGTRATESFFEVTGITATASSEGLPWGRVAANTVNGSGLTGDTDGDGIQQQRVSASTDVWHTNSDPGTYFIRWDFGSDQYLQNMLVWNINLNSETYLGIKSARIRHSMDGIAWTTLGTGYFMPGWTAANEGAPYEQYDEAFTQFNFGGVQARYVMLDNLVNLNGDTTGAIGLQEVKFYAFTPPPPVPKGTVVLLR